MIYEMVTTDVEIFFSFALLTINPTRNTMVGNSNLRIKRGQLIA